MHLFLSSYTKRLTIASFMALPIAFLLEKSFLGRFYLHAPIPLMAFLAGLVIAFVVALLTVSSQTWRVASRNPVKSLFNLFLNGIKYKRNRCDHNKEYYYVTQIIICPRNIFPHEIAG